MGTLTDDDITILKEHAEQIDYGTVEMEFKNGVCLAIKHTGRVLTKKGKDALRDRNNHKSS